MNLVLLITLTLWSPFFPYFDDAARSARDRADATALRREIAAIPKANTFEAQMRIAALDNWLCEALQAANDTKGIKEAAQAGIAAAEQAVKLRPASSEAHRLLGDLLGQLIPYVFAGGMRYGPRSTKEIDHALKLDPKNADAHIARATSYFFTPPMFGGSKDKAIEHLKTAIALDPQSDTAHLWLAQVYADLKQKDRAVAELGEARKINPGRAYLKYLDGEIGGVK